MRTTLTIILPVTLEGNAVSVSDNVGDVSKGNNSVHKEHSPTSNIDAGIIKNSCNDGTLNMFTDNDYRNRRKTCKKFHEQCKQIGCDRNSKGSSQKWNHQLTYANKQLLQQIQSFRHVPRKEQESKTPISQIQHEMSNGQLADGHVVVLDKGATRRIRSLSAAPRILDPQRFNHKKQRPRAIGDVQLSVGDAYDLDVEHQDIMMKALRSYRQHSNCQGDSHTNNSNLNETMDKSSLTNPDDYRLLVRRTTDTNNSQLVNYFNYDDYRNSKALVYDSRLVKMAQCRLRFYDDDVNENSKFSLPESSPLLYTLEDGNGVLADAVGHVSRSTKTRPWSVLPGRPCDIGDRRFQDSASTNNSTDKKNRPVIPLNANPRSQSAVTLISRAKMAQPIPHSAAYQRRNQTTHMWTDSSQLMSQSVPGASFLQRGFRTSPRSSDAGSEKGSPAGKPTKTRPSSSYSYDGGFFVGAHSGQAEYFVIHPDWVSEAVTVKKISIDDKNIGSPFQRSLSFKSRSLPDGRRCLSAPPKQRNPITMDHSESASKSK